MRLGNWRGDVCCCCCCCCVFFVFDSPSFGYSGESKNFNNLESSSSSLQNPLAIAANSAKEGARRIWTRLPFSSGGSPELDSEDEEDERSIGELGARLGTELSSGTEESCLCLAAARFATLIAWSSTVSFVADACWRICRRGRNMQIDFRGRFSLRRVV